MLDLGHKKRPESSAPLPTLLSVSEGLSGLNAYWWALKSSVPIHYATILNAYYPNVKYPTTGFAVSAVSLYTRETTFRLTILNHYLRAALMPLITYSLHMPYVISERLTSRGRCGPYPCLGVPLLFGGLRQDIGAYLA